MIHVQPYKVSIQQPIEIIRLVGGRPIRHSHYALHERMRRGRAGHQFRTDWVTLNYRPFVGPWLVEARTIESALAQAGIAATWRRRAWDAEHFPHATRGYFPFWERIKSVG